MSTVPLRLGVFGVVACLAVAACGSTSTASQDQNEADQTGAAPATEVVLPNLGPAEALVEIDGWLQSEIDSLEDLRGSVVVVQFWTFGCINCKRTLENLTALYAAHQGDDFEIVGIHSPEFDYEKDPDSIATAAADLGVTWPIALDTGKRTFFRWQDSPAYWPRTYVLDQYGNVRFDHIGEGAYDELNEAVASLLG